MNNFYDEKGKIGEDYVNQIAYSTFTKYWCYPNPLDEYGDKKEITDLLILFKDICIIIAVKNYNFKGNHERYFKKTIEKSIKQIYGAERKLFNSDHDIYIKHPIKGLQLFNKNLFKTIVRLIINLGEGTEYSPLTAQTNSGENASVLSKETVDILFTELDTISDFTQYFKSRDELIKKLNSIFVLGSEKDILASYLFNERSFKHLFNAKFDMLLLELEGNWENYITHKQVRAKKKADYNSYFIDELVKKNILNIQDGYILAEYLMQYNRFFRRIIAFSFLDFTKKYEKNEKPRFIAKRYFEIENDIFLFMYFSNDFDDEKIRKLIEIASYGFMIKNNYKMDNIFILGTKPNLIQLYFGLIKSEPLPKNIEEGYIDSLKILNWFNNLEYIPFNIKEYPDV